jgi:hypothetical protein
LYKELRAAHKLTGPGPNLEHWTERNTKEKYKKAVLLLHTFSLIHFKDCRTFAKYEARIIK